MVKSLISVVLIISCSIFPLAAQQVRIQPAQSSENASYQYYYDLLQLLLTQTADDYGEANIVVIDSPMSQLRGFSMLKADILDVFWAGTSIEREQEFHAIRIPLVGGLLGSRVPVISRDRLAEFETINTAKQLQQLVACQGSQWPDSDILQYNGYRIERVITFQLIYSMLKQQRCDYFPRGLYEAYAEVSSRGNESLMVYDKLILRYPLPMYFFVSNNNPRLAQRITQGLERLIATNKLHEFIQQHDITRQMFPLSQYRNSRIFDLTNPQLPPQTPLQRQELWIDLPQHSISADAVE
ncbi:hypothetical protein ABIS04_18375 [Shewanella sp. H8]|uniref:hypothetical protein n=1 Tax=Shewanella sp. H8 TaxID=3342676 RepID=UPI0033146B91